MPRELTPLSQTLVDLLSDGAWHDVYDLREALARTVPPGEATRATEDARSSAWRDSPPQRKQPLPLAEQVRSGQRRIARTTIRAWLKRGNIELDGPPTPEMWRRRGCRRVRLTQRPFAHPEEAPSDEPLDSSPESGEVETQ